MSALHIFDMDGTLLRGTSGPIEISRRLDRLDALLALEHRWAVEEITATEFAREVRELWHDLPPEVVAEAFVAAPWIDGIDEVCADIAARGERSMLITMSPDFFANHLHDRGIDVVCATPFPPLPFAAPVDVAGVLNPTDKGAPGRGRAPGPGAAPRRVRGLRRLAL